ncbi:unnamed protein product [Amoebophrya sp. A25]|nr:unnamed protein product [Amoebophrya sp. A25]|eukprot:GSA25T00019430001.1
MMPSSSTYTAFSSASSSIPARSNKNYPVMRGQSVPGGIASSNYHIGGGGLHQITSAGSSHAGAQRSAPTTRVTATRARNRFTTSSTLVIAPCANPSANATLCENPFGRPPTTSTASTPIVSSDPFSARPTTSKSSISADHADHFRSALTSSSNPLNYAFNRTTSEGLQTREDRNGYRRGLSSGIVPKAAAGVVPKARPGPYSQMNPTVSTRPGPYSQMNPIVSTRPGPYSQMNPIVSTAGSSGGRAGLHAGLKPLPQAFLSQREKHQASSAPKNRSVVGGVNYRALAGTSSTSGRQFVQQEPRQQQVGRIDYTALNNSNNKEKAWDEGPAVEDVVQSTICRAPQEDEDLQLLDDFSTNIFPIPADLNPDLIQWSTSEFFRVPVNVDAIPPKKGNKRRKQWQKDREYLSVEKGEAVEVPRLVAPGRVLLKKGDRGNEHSKAKRALKARVVLALYEAKMGHQFDNTTHSNTDLQKRWFGAQGQSMSLCVKTIVNTEFSQFCVENADKVRHLKAAGVPDDWPEKVLARRRLKNGIEGVKRESEGDLDLDDGDEENSVDRSD